MKKFFILTIVVSYTMVSCVFFGRGGGDDSQSISVSAYEPILMNRSEFENSISITSVKPMENAGKIYLKDQWMLLGDTHSGFHIYDNSNPENPTEIKFLSIPGSTDLAVRNNVIYVNQATDLVAFNFEPFNNQISIYKRIRHAFPPMISPDGFWAEEIENKVVIGWRLRN